MHILVTGGAGYIGSHTCLELLAAGYEVSILDNLSNSKRSAVARLEHLSGMKIPFHQVDLLDLAGVQAVFADKPVEAVIHFAALKSPAESLAQPVRYYQNNLTGTLNLLEAMQTHGVRRFVFSSSATVYGNPEQVPVPEEAPLAPINPYGQTKRMMEQILIDQQAALPDWSVVLLRYFNPVGAHASGEIGEDPRGVPNNLFPYVAQVATGKLPYLKIYGGDYDTPDGTGVRDYIHVLDLAVGHVRALQRLGDLPGVYTLNLGTGRGYSVMEVVRAFEAACGFRVPYQIVERRPGDAPVSYADPARAEELLAWQAQRGLSEMCADMWRWQKNNPNGFPD